MQNKKLFMSAELSFKRSEEQRFEDFIKKIAEDYLFFTLDNVETDFRDKHGGHQGAVPFVNQPKSIPCKGSRGTDEKKRPTLGGNMAFHQLAAMELKRKIETMIGLNSIPEKFAARHDVWLWNNGRIVGRDDMGDLQELAPSIDSTLLPAPWLPKMSPGPYVRLEELEAVEIRELMFELANVLAQFTSLHK